jgi:hypothetical protein
MPTIRHASGSDLPFLELMLFEASFWDPAQKRSSLEDFRNDPEFRKLLAAWGRRGDRAVIAADEHRGPFC